MYVVLTLFIPAFADMCIVYEYDNPSLKPPFIPCSGTDILKTPTLDRSSSFGLGVLRSHQTPDFKSPTVGRLNRRLFSASKGGLHKSTGSAEILSHEEQDLIKHIRAFKEGRAEYLMELVQIAREGERRLRKDNQILAKENLRLKTLLTRNGIDWSYIVLPEA